MFVQYMHVLNFASLKKKKNLVLFDFEPPKTQNNMIFLKK